MGQGAHHGIVVQLAELAETIALEAAPVAAAIRW
jgi:hypothetical protein